MVADVDELLPVRELLLAHVRERQHRLDLGSVARSQGGEAELARVAEEDHPPRQADAVTGRRVLRQAGMGGTHMRDRGRDGKADGVRLHPAFRQQLTLLPADAHLLGDVLVRVDGVARQAGGFGGHSAQGYSIARRLLT